MPTATSQLGGNVSSVSNLTTLMTFMKNQGLQYVIIKAAQADTVFKVNSATNFTTAIVEAGHAAGLKVFGYIYTIGANVPGEVAMANFIFQQGGDGLVYDAEVEWESNTSSSTVGTNGPALATQLCSTVRSNWPNKFMGLSTWPYRSVHTTLPYKEFAYYCDVIMPQAYWIELGDTPSACVTRVNSDWNTWKNGLTGKWTNAIKPFVMTGQGWSSASGTITPAQVWEFENALKTNGNPVSPGGFKNVDYWRAELHPSTIWTAIRTNFLSKPYTNAPVIQYVPATTVGATNASISWPTDQISDAVVEYGSSTNYGSATTNATLNWYHTVNLGGLNPNTSYHYRVKSKGTNNLSGTSVDYVFTTASAAVTDIIIDEINANNTNGHTVSYVGGWTAITGPAYLGGASYASATYNLGAPTATAKFSPSILTPGNYNVYASWYASAAGGNRATNAPFRIVNNGVTTLVRVNQEANGNSFQLLASNKFFQAGTIDYVQLGNDVTLGAGGDICVADAVKLVYVPPPPTAPLIAAQPQSQTVSQGNPASFAVSASGTGPLTYQWKQNGTNIPGATGSTYTRNNVQLSDAGTFSVGITNSVGGTNSGSATLSVVQPPFIAAEPQDLATNAGATISFSVSATGTAPLRYRWQFAGSDIAGATNSILNRTNVQLTDVGTYTVIVTNVAGNVSSSAELSFLPTTPPLLANGPFTDGKFHIRFSGDPGNYILQGSSNFLAWEDLTNFIHTNGVFEFIDPETNLPIRFYRARTQQ